MGVYAQEVEAEKREEKHVNYPEFNKDTLKVKLERKGDRHYRKYSFQKAIKKYSSAKKLTESGYRNLAESYRKIRKHQNSSLSYARFVKGKSTNIEDLFNYASVLRLNGAYELSHKWMDKFKELAPNDLRVLSFVNNLSGFQGLLEDQGMYKLIHLNANTEHQDFGTAYYNKQLVIASTRVDEKLSSNLYNWNGLPFLDLYVGDVKGLQVENIQHFKGDLNKRMHEGPASFNKKGDFIAFTRNNYKGKSEDGSVNLKIFFATKDAKGNWIDEESFVHNHAEHSIGHPCLSKDGKVMYYASDMPGGHGGVDIYKSVKTNNGWEKAENLGPVINTEDDEMFPFFHEENSVLFFASTGHLGLGGMDVFFSNLKPDKTFTEPKNLGMPLNSNKDDFALIIDEKMETGYFSSNREGGKGDDDIYGFELLRPFGNDKIVLKGVAKDQDGNILGIVLVTLTDKDGETLDTLTTEDNAAYQFNVERDKEFFLLGEKKGYINQPKATDTKTEESEVICDILLEKDIGLSLYALIQDNKTKKPLAGVKVILTDKLTGKVSDYLTPASGEYRKIVDDKKITDKGLYNLVLDKEGYFTKSVTLNTMFDKNGVVNLNALLDLGMDKEVKNLNDLVKINDIRFDVDKYNIRADAAIELDKIVKILQEYENMTVELGSHTDCRGSEAYNKKLSDRRAKSSATYIKNKIKFPERIYGKGYGESNLLNGCACEGKVKSHCSDEEHAANRRTTFKVISTGDDFLEIEDNNDSVKGGKQ
ncbi:MAG: OmpA family protein [Flavobacteriales bacterium]|nr:OmpA family protein [Flavobacteriales bacterium]